MPNKNLISNFNAIQDNDSLTYGTRSISTVFKNFTPPSPSLNQIRVNKDFKNICDYVTGLLITNLSIRFSDDKTKSILFVSKRRAKNNRKLNIRYKEINIKQQAQVTYFGCVLDESMSGEPMALRVVNKINGKQKFLYGKNKFLTPELRRMLCSALIQPYFDYAYTAW